MTAPFEKQRLSRAFATVRADWLRGQAVPGEDLLSAIEQSECRSLPADLRELIRASAIPPVKRTGHKAEKRDKVDLDLEELDKRYVDLLSKFQEEVKSFPDSNLASPSERAYRQLATEMKDVFGNIDWLALRNKHSSWRTGRIHGPREDLVDSEDFDAEIERQFPAHK